MKDLNDYIIEKLKINKDTEISIRDIYYVVPRCDVFKECKKKYEDSKINANNQGDTGFILWEGDIKYLLKKYNYDIEQFPDDFNIYIIPDEYDSRNIFKNDIEKCKIKIEDLEKINNEDFK